MQDHKPGWYSDLSKSPFRGEPQPSKEQMHYMKERFSSEIQSKSFRWKLAIPSMVLVVALVLFLFPFVKSSSIIENIPSSSPLNVTNLPASSVPKETIPVLQNQSQIIKTVKNFDIKKLRLMSVKLLGKTDIWAWGYDGSQKGRLTLISTSNSGKTWDQVTELSDEAPGMFPGPGGLPFQELAAGAFLDANMGWLAWVKDGKMTTEWIHNNKTTISTFQTAVPVSATMVESLNFVNSNDGYALLIGKSEANKEQQKFFLQTKDAGQHWSLVSSNAPEQFLAGDTIVNNLLMSKDGSGWIGIDGSQTDDLPTLYHTTNEGMSWSRIRLPIGSGTQAPPKITGISTPVTDGKGNVTIVVAFTGASSIKFQLTYHSSDNGASWDYVEGVKFNVPATENQPPLFNYVSSSIGYAVKGFDLFRTTDGGKSWKIISDDSLKKLASHYVGPINEIHFETEERGYVILEGNDYSRMILLTSNGGQTWTRLN
jgi:photosystem II stability/assembly factor-like uncharacterized protein